MTRDKKAKVSANRPLGNSMAASKKQATISICDATEDNQFMQTDCKRHQDGLVEVGSRKTGQTRMGDKKKG